MTSAHLDAIINKQHGSTTSFVVFVDVVKYSLRKSVMQQKVVQEFSKCISDAINSISAKYVVDSQKRGINLATDIIRIPTGDGAAIVFPFDGMQNMHLDFAREFLNLSLANRQGEVCSIFEKQGWCNCHNFFDVRVGVSDGKVIVFKDVNQNYNVAGGVVNLAARVMGLADKQQILFTQAAYSNIIDMTEDNDLESKFVIHGSVEIKHGVEVEVCQYIGHGENFLSKDEPINVTIAKKRDALKADGSIFGRPPKSLSPSETLENLEVMSILQDMPFPPGMENLFKGPSGKIDKDTARLMVESFKVLNKIMAGEPIQVIDSDSSD